MHDFLVRVHPSEPGLKNWKNPGKSDPDCAISETIADRENPRALSNVNPYVKVSNPLSDFSQVSQLLSNTQLKVGKMCNLEKK